MAKKRGPDMKARLAAFCLGVGPLMGAAVYVGSGSWLLALWDVALMWALGAWFYFGRGDLVETMRQTDERQQQIVGQAREWTLSIMAVPLLCGAIYELAMGRLGPYAIMGSLSGLVFLAAFLILRARA